MGRDLQEKRTDKEGQREGAKGRQNRRSRWKMKGFSGRQDQSASTHGAHCAWQRGHIDKVRDAKR